MISFLDTMRVCGVVAALLLCLDGTNGYLSLSPRLVRVQHTRQQHGEYAVSHSTSSTELLGSPWEDDNEGDISCSVQDSLLENNEGYFGRVTTTHPTTESQNVLQRQLASTALVGLLWLAPPLMTMTPEAMAAPAVAPATTEVRAPAPPPPVVIPAEKKNLDAARAALQTATKRGAELYRDLELAKTELSATSRLAAKNEQTTTKLLKAVDAGVLKLATVKKTGDYDIIVAQKDRVAAAKVQLAKAQEALRTAKTAEGRTRAQVDSLTASLSQTERTKEQAKNDVVKYEKSYKQYLDREKRIKERRTKERQAAIKKANEETKRKTDEARKKDKQKQEKERERAEQEKQLRMKQNKARQEAARKKLAEAKKKAAEAAKKAEKKAAEAAKKAEKKAKKDREKAAIMKIKQEEERKKQIAAAKKAAIERTKKVQALKVKIATLEEKKGDLIVRDAPDSKIKDVEQRIAAVRQEVNTLTASTNK